MSKLKITETSLRDGHQSLIATRLTTDEILPILPEMDKAGFYSMEVWGGATFDSCLRFLNEDPWERLRKIRANVKNTKLQMLTRGQNLLGYRHYADDIVETFLKKAIYNGIDIVRVFDALNDFRNSKKSIEVIKKEGAHCQCAISYTISPVHTLDYYLKLIKDFENAGADSICIKDMSGILLPQNAYELIKAIKEITNLPIELHNHCTSGVAQMTMQRAIDAGIDIVDTAISPLSSGTSQPCTESLAFTLQGTERDPELNIASLNNTADYFKPIISKYIDNGILSPKVLMTEPKTLLYQVPGGMLSNLISQMKSLNASDKFEDVLAEIPKVREDLGFPPLVTPMSQMVGAQAVFNIISGGRYKIIPTEIKNYVKGQYGRPAVSISEDIKKKIIGNEDVITTRPADLLSNEYDKMAAEIGELAHSVEDVLSYALFPQVAKTFFEKR
ncbi:oxaloacetate decarboxylase alpha subunit [Sedimentibacter acidaminivorans]|uniref:Oxaloacetate decarboxylase alpha subunit n=1 Tax=Sedimentibacter acidaminivorans TaxID=913099 RepID=A0ABS4GEM3_9FIRM|nr:oxaloacetate decarboxylase subunit alpha [Sedimentibacter acidaminivorans]MBP1925962.1 oxaloacetate decarboxylase alpha subunit [Sedimentibacter acidaminivorans]